MKHYRVRGEGGKDDLRPWLIFDVRFDLRDMRSRNFETLERSFVAEMIPLDEDLLWTSDMVMEHQGNFLQRNAEEIGAPDSFREAGAPDLLENKFLHYLLQHHKIMVRHNTHYDLYSSPTESVEEFRSRCADHALQEVLGGFKQMGDRFLRRLLQQEELVQRGLDEFEASLEEPSQKMLELSKVFSEIREEISSLSLGPDGHEGGTAHPLSLAGVPAIFDLKDKLDALLRELREESTRLLQLYKHRAESIDLFQLPLNRHQIDIVGTAILWSW